MGFDQDGLTINSGTDSEHVQKQDHGFQNVFSALQNLANHHKILGWV